MQTLGMHVGQLVLFSQCDRMQSAAVGFASSSTVGQVWGRWMLVFIQGWNFARWWDMRTEEKETVWYLEGSN